VTKPSIPLSHYRSKEACHEKTDSKHHYGKYRRKNLRRTPRNENGLTKRQQQKQENIKAVKQLADQGLKQREIAKELDITQARVSQILNNKI
jgi:DNA invertase Pin-like site-specific DNA recombinase